MRMQSAASAKGKFTRPMNLIPTEGSKIRKLYDQFMTNKAVPIFPDINGNGAEIIRRLTDFYGLDIRPFDRQKPRKYWLVGEWFGSTYLDYVADRRAREEREAR